MSLTDREGARLMRVRNGEQLHALRRVAYRALELMRVLDADPHPTPDWRVAETAALRQAIAAKLATPSRETAHPKRSTT
jgi:hypothetical protein